MEAARQRREFSSRLVVKPLPPGAGSRPGLRGARAAYQAGEGARNNNKTQGEKRRAGGRDDQRMEGKGGGLIPLPTTQGAGNGRDDASPHGAGRHLGQQ